MLPLTDMATWLCLDKGRAEGLCEVCRCVAVQDNNMIHGAGCLLHPAMPEARTGGIAVWPEALRVIAWKECVYTWLSYVVGGMGAGADAVGAQVRTSPYSATALRSCC